MRTNEDIVLDNDTCRYKSKWPYFHSVTNDDTFFYINKGINLAISPNFAFVKIYLVINSGLRIDSDISYYRKLWPSQIIFTTRSSDRLCLAETNAFTVMAPTNELLLGLSIPKMQFKK